ncbi:response regulator [Paenibacillus sp. P25]|nr:response regulator [Paenibacillus sp. P25]
MSSTPLTVLIVDDEQPLREELRMVPWPNFGAELAGEAENGEEALRLCEVLQPDVVITDITMPVMDGLELAKRIREPVPVDPGRASHLPQRVWLCERGAQARRTGIFN